MNSLSLLLAKKELVDVTIWCNRNEFSGTFDAHKVNSPKWNVHKYLGIYFFSFKILYMCISVLFDRYFFPLNFFLDFWICFFLKTIPILGRKNAKFIFFSQIEETEFFLFQKKISDLEQIFFSNYFLSHGRTLVFGNIPIYVGILFVSDFSLLLLFFIFLNKILFY